MDDMKQRNGKSSHFRPTQFCLEKNANGNLEDCISQCSDIDRGIESSSPEQHQQLPFAKNRPVSYPEEIGQTNGGKSLLILQPNREF